MQGLDRVGLYAIVWDCVPLSGQHAFEALDRQIAAVKVLDRLPRIRLLLRAGYLPLPDEHAAWRVTWYQWRPTALLCPAAAVLWPATTDVGGEGCFEGGEKKPALRNKMPAEASALREKIEERDARRSLCLEGEEARLLEGQDKKPAVREAIEDRGGATSSSPYYLYGSSGKE